MLYCICLYASLFPCINRNYNSKMNPITSFPLPYCQVFYRPLNKEDFNSITTIIDYWLSIPAAQFPPLSLKPTLEGIKNPLSSSPPFLPRRIFTERETKMGQKEDGRMRNMGGRAAG